MNVSSFNYPLPKNSIAQEPVSPRDHSKLLIINKKSKSFIHKHFYDLPDFLSSNDVLVFNNTKVFPGRLIAKKDTGGKVEILLIKNIEDGVWETMTKPGLKQSQDIKIENLSGTVISKDEYITTIQFNKSGDKLYQKILKVGKTPLPPYIKSDKNENKLRKIYQTVYAKNIGSIAAPTAGFHFTPQLIKTLKNKKVQLEYLTLHVGPGTFLPIKSESLESHKIHSEYFDLDKKTAAGLNKAKEEGKRIIAVGTTTTRVLETCSKNGLLIPKAGETDLFIYPSYKFNFVDSIITNFHLPKSTLLALVSALTSYPNTAEKFNNFSQSLIGKAYSEAIRENYRFYSFGDATIIL